MSKFDVITIGTATQDVYLKSKQFCALRDVHFKEKLGFLSSEALILPFGSKIEVEDVYVTTGGGAANTAVTFARQGFKTAVLAKIGKDFSGRVIEDELEKEKVTLLLARDPKERTAYSTLLLTPKGERTIFVYRGASENLKANDVPWQKLKSKWVYFAPGGINFPLLETLVNNFFTQGSFIAINPGRAQISRGLRGLRNVIQKSNVFILNREEASRLTGISYRDEKRIFSVLDRAVGGILVITDAKKGVKVSDGINRWQAGSFKEKRVVDRTGAGDSFGSGFIAGLMHKGEKCEKGICNPENIAYAIRLGSANATSNIESIGAKTGLLTRRGFAASRWGKLGITRRAL